MTLPNLADELHVGQLLMVETRHEILLGNLKHIDTNGKIIELENVRDFKTNYEYTSTQMLPLPQIQTIKIINDDYNDAENTTTATTNSKSSNEDNASASSSMSPVVGGMRTAATAATAAQQECAINLSSRELLLIQQQLGNIIYIVQSDQRYHKALADIRTQSVVSLLLEPMSFGRHNKTSLLVVGTASVVYIFDMLSLGKVFRDLREILEAKRPRKVLHYSHRIVDNLQHRLSVQLSGIFDTFVAHCLLTGQKKPLDLLDTVQRYFSISAQYFESCDEMLQPQDVYNRPVSKTLLQLLAKKVIFQYKLYEHLLHEQMLTNFYRQCDNFATSFSSNDDAVDVAIQMVPSSRKGFEHIRPQQAWNEVLNKDLANLQLE